MASTFLKIAVPSVLTTYLILQYFDPDQNTAHSAKMKRYLQGQSIIVRAQVLVY